MSMKKILLPIAAVYALITFACVYIVLPVDLDTGEVIVSRGWNVVATNVSQTDAGDLHIDLSIRNDTGDWSAMQAAPGIPAVLSSGGTDTDCGTVFVGTGGHRLAPGFQVRGYIGGTKAEQTTQLLYVDCAGQPPRRNPHHRLQLCHQSVQLL
jgi:hypothetical protein